MALQQNPTDTARAPLLILRESWSSRPYRVRGPVAPAAAAAAIVFFLAAFAPARADPSVAAGSCFPQFELLDDPSAPLAAACARPPRAIMPQGAAGGGGDSCAGATVAAHALGVYTTVVDVQAPARGRPWRCSGAGLLEAAMGTGSTVAVPAAYFGLGTPAAGHGPCVEFPAAMPLNKGASRARLELLDRAMSACRPGAEGGAGALLFFLNIHIAPPCRWQCAASAVTFQPNATGGA